MEKKKNRCFRFEKEWQRKFVLEFNFKCLFLILLTLSVIGCSRTLEVIGGGGAIMTTGLKEYFLIDSWQFLYTYQLRYISGPSM